jgi:hypothetical protein
MRFAREALFPLPFAAFAALRELCVEMGRSIAAPDAPAWQHLLTPRDTISQMHLMRR